jgi:hypothetical protein
MLAHYPSLKFPPLDSIQISLLTNTIRIVYIHNVKCDTPRIVYNRKDWRETSMEKDFPNEFE